jgi:hypothetical protein
MGNQTPGMVGSYAGCTGLSFFGTSGVQGNHHKALIPIALTRKMVFMVSEVSERSDNIPGVSFYMWW